MTLLLFAMSVNPLIDQAQLLKVVPCSETCSSAKTAIARIGFIIKKNVLWKTSLAKQGKRLGSARIALAQERI